MGFMNTTAAADTLRETYTPGYDSAVVRNNQLLGLTLGGRPVFPRAQMPGEYVRWTVNTAGASPEIFTEGQGAPSPTGQSYTELYEDAVYFWVWPRISGHLRDIVRNGGARPGQNPIEQEFMGGFEDIRDLVTTTFLGSTYGLAHIIDDGNTVHGVAQGSNTWHQAAVENVNGALARSEFIDILEEQREGNGRASLIIAPNNQISNYIYLTGEPNAQNSSLRVDVGLQGGGLDLVPSMDTCSVMGIPMVGLQDVTDDDIYGLDIRNTRFGPNWQLFTAREMDVRGPQMVGDDDVFELSSAYALVCRLVQRNFKLEDVSA